MAIDLAGIHNVGEFYSHHYLDALLDRDLKGLFAQWRKQGDAAPDRRLEGCATRFFRAKSLALRQPRLEDRYPASHEIHVQLLEALGYPYDFQVQYLADGSALPVLSAVKRDGREHVWLAETVFAEGDDSPLDQPLLANQFPQAEDGERPEPPEEPWESLIGQVFARDEPPRWLVLFAGRLLYLFDRTKWGRGQYLLFDLDEIFGRRQRDALRVTAALLARDALSPDDGLPLHDTLDENSHKHAYGVSEDLKYGVRRAVELLANEYVWYMRNVRKEKLFGDDALAGKLTREPLTYLYRLLFLFYAEARGAELGLVPMKAEAYRTGYSIEALRDLEQVPLNTPEAQNGYYIDTSLNQLFKLINEGYPVEAFRQLGLEEPGETFDDYGFTVTGLRSPLFSRESTPLLSSAKFRNVVLQEVLQLLSLSREQRGRRSVRGRISYAQLGINQLGAVYEGLLSYSGFFAQEPLVEVKPADANASDEMAQTYFVPLSDAERYKKDEFVYEEGVRKTYPRGTFIFRLAGRDREKSASYYTPEVLTRCVVKNSLKELLPGNSADEILGLTICEPAMGSGAFINEALNQLADAYLERKQEELGEGIAPEQYRTERQKVKAYMAQHNAYGVDLNPTATELAQVSIWLNTLYPGMTAPWYEARMAVGNSLIGARRQVYSAEDVKSGTYAGKAPTPVPLSQPRPQGSVYHWLLPDQGMAAFDRDKVIKELAPDEVQAIKDWRKGFTARITTAELKNMQALSDMADALWARHTAERQALLEHTREPVAVWPQPEPEAAGSTRLSIEEKRRALARLQRPTGPYRRLKLAMDYWCALWFWPIPEAGVLPTRRQFLDDLADILKGEESGFQRVPEQTSFLEPATAKQSHLADLAALSVDTLCAENQRLATALATGIDIKFHHWELAFAELFADRFGFDLIVGNPPWVLVSFDEAGVLSDYDPRIALRRLSAAQVAELRAGMTTEPAVLKSYLHEYVEQTAAKAFFGARANYPLLGGKPNLYKCFLTRAWGLGSDLGAIGFLHPEGVYDDPKAGFLRQNLYPRLRAHFQFQNALFLFSEVHDQTMFSVNVYGVPSEGGPTFSHIANLYHPSTIDRCFEHDGLGAVPGMRDENGQWELRGHRSRVVSIDADLLALFARLYDEPGTPLLRARLPAVHSREVVQVLRKFASQERKLGDLEGHFFTTQFWNETNAQKDGTIRREVRYPTDISEWIISGPHFFVATPFYKTPNEGCRHNQDYSEIDLTKIPDDYLPRTNYVPACSAKEYLRRTPRWNGQPLTGSYRHANREMIGPTSERTLISAIIPPGVAHIHTVFSAVFDNLNLLADYEVLASSIPVDFLVKSTGAGHANLSLISFIPIPESRLVPQYGRIRILRLNCVTSHYGELWNSLFVPDFSNDAWASSDPRLPSWCKLTGSWHRDFALRTPFARRQALVEIDVLAAMALDLTLDELLTIYRVQFPVLQKYERRMLFDQRGMQVAVRTIRGELVVDEDHPDFPDMAPPFTPVDREDDYREAWAHFEKVLGRND